SGLVRSTGGGGFCAQAASASAPPIRMPNFLIRLLPLSSGLFRQGNRQGGARFLRLIRRKLGVQVDDFRVTSNSIKEEGAVAMRRLALHAQQRARFLAREREHLGRLHDRLGKLELAGVDALQIVMPARSRRSSSLRRRAERL